MSSFAICHTALFLGENSGKPTVRILAEGGTDACGGCALASTCKSAATGEFTINVEYNKTLSAKPEPGQKVRIEAIGRATAKAALVLFVLPLAVFLGIALCFSQAGAPDGLTAAAALGAAVLAYAIVYLSNKKRQNSVWQIIDIL